MFAVGQPRGAEYAGAMMETGASIRARAAFFVHACAGVVGDAGMVVVVVGKSRVRDREGRFQREAQHECHYLDK